jgi:hypothetical protein
MAAVEFGDIMATCNLEILRDKKNVAFGSKYQVRSKIILKNETIEQTQKFN